MTYATKMVEVEFELDDFDDDDIVEYLQGRGYIIGKDSLLNREEERALHELYLDYVDGKNTDKAVKKVLDELYKYVPLRSV